MSRIHPPTEEVFKRLLSWLDSDELKAQKRYLTIQSRLIGIFSAKGCKDPEHLADRSFDVAASKVDWLLENYVGDPALYVLGIARKLFLDDLKPKSFNPPPPPDATQLEIRSNCLDSCLAQLASPEDGSLVLRYHSKEKAEKIKLRRQIAEELGISMNALRIKVSHIQSRLRTCLDSCLKLADG